MKRLLTLIIAAIALQSCSLAHLIPSHASPSVDVTINIDLQPAWGPIGYDYAAYYYMPEINIYYDINHSRFYYPSGSRWISAEYLPPSYRVYDLFKVYKVVFNYEEPWKYNRTHRTQYKHYRDDRSQIPIRMSNDKRYEKSWDNLRPWVDPDRRNNRESNYHLRTQNQQAGSSKYIEDHRNNGYRVEGTEHKKQGPTAGGSYRDKDRTPNKGTSSSSSYLNQQQPKQPAADKKPATEKPQKSATSPKPSTEEADRQPSKTDKSYNAPSSSSSYRQQNGAQSSSASDGVSSRGKARSQSTAESKSKANSSKSTATKSSSKSSTKPSTEKSTRSKSSQSSSNTSPSASYRAGNSSSANTSTRGR